MAKAIQYAFLLLGVAGAVTIGLLLNDIAKGSGFIFWVAMILVLLYALRRYPREEVFAVFGFGFGFFCPVVLGGAYLFARAGYTAVAVVWLALWTTGFIAGHRRLQRSLTPTFYIADEFVRMVGPIPVQRRIHRGCVFTGLEGVLLFFFLMVAGLLGPLLWIVQIAFLLWFLKRTRGRPFSWGMLVAFIAVNVVVLVVLYQAMDELGFEHTLRKLLGG
jgi:hypothetical protein